MQSRINTRDTTQWIILTVLLFASNACAQTTRELTSQGWRFISHVNVLQFSQMALRQQQTPAWCWAACISTVFSFYGHPVSQERIIAEAYGGAANVPACYGCDVAQKLNRIWTDDHGRRFRPSFTAIYDIERNMQDLKNSVLINELDGNRPVVIGSGTHAMVLTSIQFANSFQDPVVQRYEVFDPWPDNGTRALTPKEASTFDKGGDFKFAAVIRIDDIDD